MLFYGGFSLHAVASSPTAVAQSTSSYPLPPSLKTYRYRVLLGTTGNDTQIWDKGHWVDIRHTDRSDKATLHALYGLRWQVLDPNSAGDNITVAGRLLPTWVDEVIQDSKTGTRIYDFELKDWKIRVPFKEYAQPSGWLPGDDYEVLMRSHLRRSSFRWPVSGNLQRFERPVPVKRKPTRHLPSHKKA